MILPKTEENKELKAGSEDSDEKGDGKESFVGDV